MSRKRHTIWRIVFVNQGRTLEIYADQVKSADVFGFVEVAGLRFGQRSELLVDPGSEQLEREFAGVSRTLVPMHSIVRLDEVTEEGPARVRGEAKAGDNVHLFPLYTPPGKS
jgi:hypothetical protein